MVFGQEVESLNWSDYIPHIKYEVYASCKPSYFTITSVTNSIICKPNVKAEICFYRYIYLQMTFFEPSWKKSALRILWYIQL